MTRELYRRQNLQVLESTCGEAVRVITEVEEGRLATYRPYVELNAEDAAEVADVLATYSVESLVEVSIDPDLEELARAYLAAYDAADRASRLEKEAKRRKEIAAELLLRDLGEDDAIKLDGRLVSPTKRFRVATRPDAYEGENLAEFHEAMASAGVICKPNARTLASVWKNDWSDGKKVPEALAGYLSAESVRGLSVRKS